MKKKIVLNAVQTQEKYFFFPCGIINSSIYSVEARRVFL